MTFFHPHVKLTTTNYNKISQDKRIQPDSNVKGDNCDNGSETIILKRQLYENYSHSSTVPEVNQS